MDGEGGGFHRTEAISAVQDEEQFYGEDEDYEDLYNDVNVGEGFYQQSLQINEKGTTEELVTVPPPPQPHQLPPPQPHQLPPPQPHQLPPPPEKPQISPDVKAHEPPLPPVQQQLPPPPQAQFQQGGNFAEANSNNFNGGGGNFNNGSGNFAAGTGGNFAVGGAAASGGGGTTTLFVGDLHWWTTDADLESELVKYGLVKEVKFFDEKASGKSKGYAQVDFYDPAVATACKENMNGHLFNGRPCVVAYSSPYSIRRMGEAQVSRNLQGANQNQNQNQNMNGQNQPGMVNNKGRVNGPPLGGANNSFGGRAVGNGGNWGRGGGMGGRGGAMGNMRNNRMGPMGGGRGMMGNNGMVGPPPQMMHPGAMLGQGFDYGGMGRMGAGFGGFPGPMGGPYPGMMPPFRPVVAPHVNPAFFGRGMQGGGPGMWQDPNMGGWGGEEQSSYGEDAGSEHQYGGDGGVAHVKERERTSERGGSERRHEREKDVGRGQEIPERRHRGEDRERERERSRDYDRERERSRDRDRERERHRDDKDRHGDHHSSRHRERERERDVDGGEDWGRGRKGRSRSRDVDNVKRRRGSE